MSHSVAQNANSDRPLNWTNPPVIAATKLIGASGLASRALIHDAAERPTTLDECFAFVATHPEVPKQFREVTVAARDAVTQLTGRIEAPLPANPVELRPLLAGLRLKTRAGSHKRWTVAGMLRSTLILTGWITPDSRMRYKLPRGWELLLVAAGKAGKRRDLASFLRHCHRLGLGLTEITSTTLLDYVDLLSRQTLDPDPWTNTLQIQRSWKFMQKVHMGWPKAELQLPPRRSSPIAARADLRVVRTIGAGDVAHRSLITEDAKRPPNLGACLDFVASCPDLPRRFRRDVLGAKASIARLTTRDPTDLSPEPVLLRPILIAVRPIENKISNKRWRNVLSLIRSVLILTGWVSVDSRKRYVLPDPWAALLSSAQLHHKDKPLAPFARFCWRSGFAPSSVTADTLRDYVDWLTTSTLEPDPRYTAISVQSAWRYMQRADAAWPVAAIGLPSNKVVKVRSDLPSEFHADVDAYLESLSRHHLRDSTYGRPLAPASLRTVRSSLLRAGSYLMNLGTLNSGILNIATLVKPTVYESILLAALADAGGKWNTLSKHIATNLLLAAKRWVKSSQTDLTDLEEQCHCVNVTSTGRSRRNQLAQFATPEDRAALFDVPWTAFGEADLMFQKGSREPAAKLHETALALALLFTQPIRIGNLSELDIGRHFERDRRGKLKRIFVNAGEVKNGRSIEVFLPDQMAAKIDHHLKVFRPLLLRGVESTAVFPGKNGQPLQANAIGRRLRRVVEQQLGSHFTAHLGRHLAVEMLLEADVNNLPLAQRLLGHTRPETTVQIYGLVRTSAAQRSYAKLVENDRSAIVAPRGIRRRGED